MMIQIIEIIILEIKYFHIKQLEDFYYNQIKYINTKNIQI